MAKNTETLNELLSPVVIHLGYEFVGCQYIPQGRHSLLRVYIDKAEGITLDDCQRVSEQLSAVLDVEDPISSHYSLEVSSPGIERPLFTLDHYRRFLGEQAHIHLHTPLQNRRNFKGILKEINDNQIMIEKDGIIYSIPLSQIEKANLIANW